MNGGKFDILCENDWAKGLRLTQINTDSSLEVYVQSREKART